MKLYNNNTVKQYKTIQTNDGTLYPDKLTIEQLNSYGYCTVNKWAEESLVDNLTTIEECQQFVVQ